MGHLFGHSHDHNHEHTHEHEHKHEGATPAEETLALLKYMIHHNKQHADELKELQPNLSEEAQKQLAIAIDAFGKANEELEKVLPLMEK